MMVAHNRIVQCAGSIEAAVSATVTLSRILWQLAFSVHRMPRDAKGLAGEWVYLIEEPAKVELSNSANPCMSIILEELAKKDRCIQGGDGILALHADVFHPSRLVRLLLTDVRPDHELQYFVMRHIRLQYGSTHTHVVVRRFVSLAEAANRLRAQRLESGSRDKSWPYHEFLSTLRQELENTVDRGPDAERAISLFLEASRALGYIQIRVRPEVVRFHATVDAEYMLSHLFGMSTDIPGFDNLFGGGGLMLAERPYSSAQAVEHTDQLPGRNVLLMGRFGTGKTVLALKLAVEVARKGGAAWVMPLEQSAEECLYVLEAMEALPRDGSVLVTTDPISTRSALLHQAELRKQAEQGKQVVGQGLLIILKTIKDSYEDFLSAFQENAEYLLAYPLRMVLVDPINSVLKPEDHPVAQLRAETLEAIDAVTETGTNILLVGEESVDTKGNEAREELLFEQNIADTVIRLTVQQQAGYAQRMFEVMKSRYQREVRGRHPFAIVAGKGISISPSSPAVMSRISARSPREPFASIKFGLPQLDTILARALMSGDTVVVRGPKGSFKTELGVYFLTESDPYPGASSSLFVAARDNELTVRYLLSRIVPNGTDPKKKIRICSLPKGYVDPGYILQTIEHEFDRAQLDGKPIDRVLIDDVAYWEMSCPLVRADPAFGDTLVELVRRRGATGLFICGEDPGEMQGIVQRPIANSADCEIVVNRFMFHGVDRVNLRVLKTRGMQHLREAYEVTFNPRDSAIIVKPNSSLLRIDQMGQVEQIHVRLLLHAENDAQINYNNRLKHYLQSVLFRDTELEMASWVDISNMSALTTSSAINELQILQVDEFQLSEASRNVPVLRQFPDTLWQEEKEWQDFVPRLTERVRTVDDSFTAVPLYGNVSLLAFQADKLDQVVVKSWVTLAQACVAWEEQHSDPNSLFFEFPRATAENYNCLFLEILLSLQPPQVVTGAKCQLARWLCSDDAIPAAMIYRRLCRRAYFKTGGNDLNKVKPVGELLPVKVTVDPQAVVWRHWYNTLVQMMNDPGLEDATTIKVVPLPKDISIAGEWYLAVPAYSAAPDVGLEIIKRMTTREAEVERLQLGIGLPTRQTYYVMEGTSALFDSAISENMSMSTSELRNLIGKAIHRSDFGCYSRVSNTVAYALQRIIEIPEIEEGAQQERIKRIFRDLEANISFLLKDWDCADCQVHSSRSSFKRNADT